MNRTPNTMRPEDVEHVRGWLDVGSQEAVFQLHKNPDLFRGPAFESEQHDIMIAALLSAIARSQLAEGDTPVFLSEAEYGELCVRYGGRGVWPFDINSPARGSVIVIYSTHGYHVVSRAEFLAQPAPSRKEVVRAPEPR